MEHHRMNLNQCNHRRMLIKRPKRSVSLSAVILAFEDASGYLNHSHVKRMERNGSVHLGIIVVDGDADKTRNGNRVLESLDEKRSNLFHVLPGQDYCLHVFIKGKVLVKEQKGVCEIDVLTQMKFSVNVAEDSS
ncbi:protein phosphatase 1d isoform x1 [Limosa lapponica baueri]|uniref:Protein phosphatase 1d isoform x1 n=1 Tax=Limosa lapponica baueri TaxID=1758121 RepID=A0A2I0T4P1_LIMLA|nr:protein phosphatase 1d isoform x1 [Limosa lapponica baueri]